MCSPWYVVKRGPWAGTWDNGDALWLEDAGRSLFATESRPMYSSEFGRSVWFDTLAEAREEMHEAGLDLEKHTLVQCTIDPAGGNHYIMRSVPWEGTAR